MAVYTVKRLAVDAKEAVEISKHMDVNVTFYDLFDLFREVHKLIPCTENMGTGRIHPSLICAAIWTAGRVHGIREERARRRK